MTAQPLPVVLTIAGSDSGGGAGIQADLKAFTALGCFGTSAVTCITAQNPDAVTGVEPIGPDMVARQIRAVCDGFPVAAAKTGMLYSAEIIEAVAETVRACVVPNLVVDPVMVATSGAKLLRDDAVAALRERLLPLAAVITPNIPEAEILGDLKIATAGDQRAAAAQLARRYNTACVVKGGHLWNAECGTPNAEGARLTNVLASGEDLTFLDVEYVEAVESHGTGCTFGAAVAALLARGETLADAVRGAGEFVTRALRNARPAGRHTPMWMG